MRLRHSIVRVGLASVLAIGSLSVARPVSAANNSEQVVFSGTGFGNFDGTDTPLGFWIWCEADSENPYAGACSGAMYFYALGITRGVKGFITEGEEHVYTMHVNSTRDGAVACTLTNDLPIEHGPRNTVNVDCTDPSGSGTSTNAIVNVTGP